MNTPPSKSRDTGLDQSPIPESTNLLADDAFSNERSQQLFEAIDELQRCGASRDIELPQLVIVGDQSAGKSSLLQSLTDIPFPVAGRLCTRFPTRIISRRTPGEVDLTRITIEADDSGHFSQSSKEERQRQYATFGHSSPSFTAKEFLTVVDKATGLMGITDNSQPEYGNSMLHTDALAKHFSSDILRVEISGPNRSHFSILDLPGVFHSLTKNLTVEEKDGVRELVASHMKSRESVIVCVASGTNDIANQAILDMASQYDPEGRRTVGVITKCDATQHANEVLKLAQNQEKYLRHGWFVVRNRTPAEAECGIVAHERDVREQGFFNNLPWNILPKSRRGVQALKKFLADLLCARIQMGFPSMLETIQSRRSEAASELDALGTPRKSLSQKRDYIAEIARKFNKEASLTLDGRYGSLKNDKLKLRREIRDANDVFMREIKLNGHLIPFSEIPYVADTALESNGLGPSSSETNATGLLSVSQHHDIEAHEPRDINEDSSSSEYERGTRPSKASSNGQYAGGLFAANSSPYRRKRMSPSRLSRTSTPSKSKPITQEDSDEQSSVQKLTHRSPLDKLNLSKGSDEIYHWIHQEIEGNRGVELQGTLNPDVLMNLFHKQAGGWRRIAKVHFQSVVRSTTSVLKKILEETECDPVTRRRILPLILAASEAQEMEKVGLLDERMDAITSKHLQTNNSAFLENVAKARLQRFHMALHRYQQATSTQRGGDNNQSKLIIDMRNTAALFSELHMSSARNLENDIHDTLKAYYEIARDDFIEFVTQLVVEKFVDNERGPVLLFSPTYITSLSDEAITDLAVEDEAVLRDMAEKEETLARLKRAEKIALKYA